MLSRNHPDRIRIAFDDTRWKQPSVYSSLKGHPPPVRRGQREEPARGREGPHQPLRLTQLHGHTRHLNGSDGDSDGIARWRCTTNYKIRPIRRRIQEMLGLKRRQRVPAGTTVELWLGISSDEAISMKTSRDRWIEMIQTRVNTTSLVGVLWTDVSDEN